MSTNGIVLIADDEQRILKALGRALREDGHEVVEASSGRAAQRLLAERMPELDAGRFGDVDLAALARAQLGKIPPQLPAVAPHAE